jgi:DNA invertase Pin-like site-specific DNA recombinase
MKYVIYLRVSTEQQGESGLGIEAQRAACHKFIRENALNNNEDIIEFKDEGFSGSLDYEQRPGLLNAIAALKKGDILLVAKRDRLGRDVGVNSLIERAVIKKKAKIASAAKDSSYEDDFSSIVMRRMADVFAEIERYMIRGRTKAALQAKKANGERVGRIPYGYKLAEDGKHLEICSEELNLLNQIISLKSQGMSLREIAKDLNSRQLCNRGNRWTHYAIFRLLKTPQATKALYPC